MEEEKGFYHPDFGYWQTNTIPTEEQLADHPEGTIEVPLKPGDGYEWDENTGKWVFSPPAPERGAVNAERTRRLELGVDIPITGKQTPVRVTGRSEDRDNLNGLAVAAMMRRQNNDNTTTGYRDGNDVVHDLNPAQLLELYQGAMQYTEQVYQASWALKEMEVIPQDYQDDKYWP